MLSGSGSEDPAGEPTMSLKLLAGLEGPDGVWGTP